MAKGRVGVVGLSGGEKRLGWLPLVCCLAVFPLLAGRVFDMAEYLVGVSLGSGLRNAIYFYALSAVTLVVFRSFWAASTRALFANMGRVLSSLGMGLVAFYGLNELSTLLLRRLPLGMANLNDAAVSAQLGTSPGSTILIVVFLAPAVEETLFRGYIFGILAQRGRAAAYIASCLLWALAHVWQYAAGNWSYLLMLTPYILPGLVMAWTYERAGNLWGSVLLHGAVNALAVWSVL